MQASLLVCDDSRLEITGKGILIGIYVTDMIITAPKLQIAQLQFFLMFDFDVHETPKTLTFEVTLPNQPPTVWPLTMPDKLSVPEGRDRAYIRQPFQIIAPILEPGRIEARVIHDKGDVRIRGPWIVLAPQQSQQPAVQQVSVTG